MASSLPLDGIRILDMGQFWAAPNAGRVWGEAGAEVIKVESCRRPDPLRVQARGIYPDHEPGEDHWNRSGMVNERNRNKLSLAIDLSQPRGRELFLELVKVSDVVSQNYSGGVMERLERIFQPFSDRLAHGRKVVLCDLVGLNGGERLQAVDARQNRRDDFFPARAKPFAFFCDGGGRIRARRGRVGRHKKKLLSRMKKTTRQSLKGVARNVKRAFSAGAGKTVETDAGNCVGSGVREPREQLISAIGKGVMTQTQIPQFTDAEFEENTLATEEAQTEAEILREFQADGSTAEWRVKIKKVNERTKKQDDCFECSPDEIRGVAERLEDEYGSGEYRLYVMRDSKIKHNLRLGIARRRVRETPADPSAGIVPQIASMIDRNTEVIASIARGAPATSAAPDQNAVMNGMLDTLIKMKEFAAPAGGGEKAGNMADFMELWQFAKETAAERGAGGASTAADVFSEFLKSPIASELAESIRENRRLGVEQHRRAALMGPRPAAPAPPGEAPGARPPSPGAPPAERQAPAAPVVNGDARESAAQIAPRSIAYADDALPAALSGLDPNMRAELKGFVDHWVTRAEAGSDPGLYAEVALDNYPVEIIRATLLRDDIRAVAVALNGAVEVNWPWFADLLGELRHLLTQAEKDAHQSDHVSDPQKRAAPASADGSTERGGGGGGDADDHAGAGASGADQSEDKGESG